jgi:hypothetical protein
MKGNSGRGVYTILLREAKLECRKVSRIPQGLGAGWGAGQEDATGAWRFWRRG